MLILIFWSVITLYMIKNLAVAEPIESSALPTTDAVGLPPICRWCACDASVRTVTCTSLPVLFRLIRLPEWAESFHAVNLTLPMLPHFADHRRLRQLRINHCSLRHAHPLSFVPLPNLDTVDFADNALEEVPQFFLQPLAHLRTLNLARNKLNDLAKVNLTLAQGVTLDELNLDGNPLRRTPAGELVNWWPKMRHLRLAHSNVAAINGTALMFKSADHSSHSSKIDYHSNSAVQFPKGFWEVLEVLDLNGNNGMRISRDVFPMLFNRKLRVLKLSSATLPTELLAWINATTNSLKHLDLSRAVFVPSSPVTKHWSHCGPRLEWLDISGLELESVSIGAMCPLRWLYADSNQLDELRVDSSSSLISLSANNNRLCHFPLITEAQPHRLVFKTIQALYLSNNSIEDFPDNLLEAFPSLETLELSDNRIEDVFLEMDKSREDQTQLRFLNFSNNGMKRFEVIGGGHLLELTILDVSNNALAHFPTWAFEWMPALEHLHLNRNPHIVFAAPNAPNLELVELDVADSAQISFSNLSVFTKLRILNLGKNKLEMIDGQMLPKSLTHINLSQNSIRKMANFSKSQLDNIMDLDASLNPFDCKCPVQWKMAALLKQQPDIRDRNAYFCFEDNWQHPLDAYLTAESLEACPERDNQISGFSFSSLMLNFLTLVLLMTVTTLLVAFVFSKMKLIGGLLEGPAGHGYRPMHPAEIDPPAVSL